MRGNHIKGSSNVLVDSLLRGFHVPLNIMALTFTTLFHPQVLLSPFRIVWSSFKVISWMRLLVPSATVKEVLPCQHKRSCLGICLNGGTSWRASVSEISGLMESHNRSELSLLGDLLRLSAKISSARRCNKSYFPQLSKEHLAQSGLSSVKNEAGPGGGQFRTDIGVH